MSASQREVKKPSLPPIKVRRTNTARMRDHLLANFNVTTRDGEGGLHLYVLDSRGKYCRVFDHFTDIVADLTPSETDHLIDIGHTVHPEREWMTIDHNNPTVRTTVEAIVAKITICQFSSLDDILEATVHLVRASFVKNSGEVADTIYRHLAEFVKQYEGEYCDTNKLIPLSAFLTAGVGACRHQSALTALVLQALIWGKYIPSGPVFRQRGKIQGGYHAWLNYLPETDEEFLTPWVIDPGRAFVTPLYEDSVFLAEAAGFTPTLFLETQAVIADHRPGYTLEREPQPELEPSLSPTLLLSPSSSFLAPGSDDGVSDMELASPAPLVLQRASTTSFPPVLHSPARALLRFSSLCRPATPPTSPFSQAYSDQLPTPPLTPVA